ncbi:MAG: twin-arginine translocase subunit TatC [Halorhabdus sp.]
MTDGDGSRDGGDSDNRPNEEPDAPDEAPSRSPTEESAVSTDDGPDSPESDADENGTGDEQSAEEYTSVVESAGIDTEPEPVDSIRERVAGTDERWEHEDLEIDHDALDPDVDSGGADDTEHGDDPDGSDDSDGRPVRDDESEADETPPNYERVPQRKVGPTPGESVEPGSPTDHAALDTVDRPTVGPDTHAPDDEEMPLADHVEEMVRRLGVILVLMAGVSAIVFPFGEHIINTIWYSFLPGSYELCPTTSVIPRDPTAVITATMVDVGAGPGVTMAEGATIKPACPRVYQPLATIFARLKVSTLAGFVVALPAFVYETYLFMRPGLYPRERRYYLAAVPTSLVLATIGVAFAYLLVLPAIFTYFLYYSQGAAEIAFGLTQTFDLMVLMMGFFAAIFQIPLFIMLAIMMGVTSREWLADRRLLFWAAFAGIAFVFNPDPTGMAPFIIAATMIALFEGTLLLLSWTGSDGLLPTPEAVAARRPYAWLVAGVIGYLASTAPLPEGFYDQLPDLLVGFIEGNDLVGMTPIVVGGLLIGVYEAIVFLLRRYLPVGSWRRRLFTGRVSLRRVRAPVWLLSLTVGYLASPRPFLLDRAEAVAFGPLVAAGLTVGLIVAFEVLLAVWQYVRPEADQRLPLEK